jgi:hypothetical protein
MTNDFKNLALAVVDSSDAVNEFGYVSSDIMMSCDPEIAKRVSITVFGKELEPDVVSWAMAYYTDITVAVALAFPEGCIDDDPFLMACKALQKYWPEELTRLEYPLSGARVREVLAEIDDEYGNLSSEEC